MAMMMRAKVLSLARKSECLKFQILSRRDEFSTKISLFFLSAEVYVYKTPSETTREKRKRKRRLLFPAFSLLCVFVRSVFILLRKERNNVFLCVVVCFFSRVCVFL